MWYEPLKCWSFTINVFFSFFVATCKWLNTAQNVSANPFFHDMCSCVLMFASQRWELAMSTNTVVTVIKTSFILSSYTIARFIKGFPTKWTLLKILFRPVNRCKVTHCCNHYYQKMSLPISLWNSFTGTKKCLTEKLQYVLSNITVLQYIF